MEELEHHHPQAKPEILKKRTRQLILFTLLLCLALISFLFVYSILLTPLLISLFFTYMLLPPVRKLEGYKIPRGVSISVFILVSFVIFLLAFLNLLPYLYSEILRLIQNAPDAFDRLTTIWLPEARKTFVSFHLFDENKLDFFLSEAKGMLHLSERIEQALSTVWRTAPRLFSSALNLILIPFFTFFFVKDWENIRARALLLTPPGLRPGFFVVADRLDKALRSIIQGQILIALTLTVLYTIGLNLAGIPAATTIALIAGPCRLIPYLDLLVGIPLSLLSLSSDFQGFAQLLFVLGVFLAVQAIDGMFITPKILGERVGLHPFVVIISVIAFGSLLGFWGVLLAIPLLAVLKTLWTISEPHYLESKIYKPDL
ncbi:MAG: AI-2E family transporter [Oligoflexales bacterium]|nr:AI-2E family transporter [Oligoflexales bacterium]